MIYLSVLALILLGWLAGKLVNELSDRLPNPKPWQPAACPTCQTPRSGWKAWLMPISCPHCERFPMREWLVQIVFCTLTPLAWFFPPPSLNFLLSFLLLIFFGITWVVDMEHRLILPIVLLPGVVICIFGGISRVGLPSSLVGAVVALLILLTLHLLGFVFVRVLSRLRQRTIDEVAFAFGDVLLGIINGFLLGFPAVLSGLVLTVLIAGGVSIIYLIYLVIRRRYHLGSPIPYAPFLILGALITLYR